MKLKMLALAIVACPLLAASPQPIASLAQAEALAGPAWFGYAITVQFGVGARCNDCRLTSDDGFSLTRRDKDDLGPSESRLLLFVRLRDHQVDRMRLFSPDCKVDANGQSVYWIDNVNATESIAFLNRVVDRGTERGRNGALLALSLHAGATDTLINIARNNPSPEVRGKALFWLSQQAGEKAASALRDAVENDPEEEVKSKAVFGISQLPDDQSVPMLIDLLKHHRSRQVRKKAAFWLGQKKDPRALQAIEDILRQ
jgi:hypothetical protein